MADKIPKEKILFYMRRHLNEVVERTQVEHDKMARDRLSYEERQKIVDRANVHVEEREALQTAFNFIRDSYPQ